MKICPVVAELFHADGQAGVTKLRVAYRNFAKAPTMYKLNLFSSFCVIWHGIAHINLTVIGLGENIRCLLHLICPSLCP
jgi:hypothetical protein